MAIDIKNKQQAPSPLPELAWQMAGYPQRLTGYDEMWNGATNDVNLHWHKLMCDLAQLGGGELERRRYEARRLLRENGVTYNIYNDSKGQQRTWQLDPVPLVIKTSDWAAISTGLKQRARLLV